MTLMTFLCSDSSLCSGDCVNVQESAVVGIVSPLLQKKAYEVDKVSCKDMEEKAQVCNRQFTMAYDIGDKGEL